MPVITLPGHPALVKADTRPPPSPLAPGERGNCLSKGVKGTESISAGVEVGRQYPSASSPFLIYFYIRLVQK